MLGLLVSGTDGFSRVDRIAFELDLFGDFACDLALGDSERKREIHPTFLLLMGRDSHLNEVEKERLRYRNQHVLVRSERVFCFTFDAIYDFLQTKLDNIRGYSPILS